MDSFGQIGPEKGDYAPDVRRVARGLRNGGAVFIALTHRMTKMNLVMALRREIDCLGAVPEGLTDDQPGEWLFIARPEYGAYWFKLGGYVAPDYIAQKLGTEPVDGETIGEFFTRLHHELQPMGAAA